MRNELYDFANQLNNMFYSGGFKSFPIDVIEGENQYIVEAEIPGVSKEDINVTFEDSVLTISATPKKNKEEKKYLIHERNNMKLERSIYFNDIEEDSLKASYNDGVLRVVITLKAPEVKEKKQIVIE